MQCARCQTSITLEAISDGLGPLNNNVFQQSHAQIICIKMGKTAFKKTSSKAKNSIKNFLSLKQQDCLQSNRYLKALSNKTTIVYLCQKVIKLADRNLI